MYLARKKRKSKLWTINSSEDYNFYFVVRALTIEKRLAKDRTHLMALGLSD